MEKKPGLQLLEDVRGRSSDSENANVSDLEEDCISKNQSISQIIRPSLRSHCVSQQSPNNSMTLD